MNFNGINIDYSRDSYGILAMDLLQKHYLKYPEESVQEAIARTVTNFCYGDYELAQRLYDHVSNRNAIFSSPQFSNSLDVFWSGPVTNWENTPEGRSERLKHIKNIDDINVKALPISCFLMEAPDTLEGQMNSSKEMSVLSTVGGGLGVYLGMRGITEKSPGAIPYLKTLDSNILYYHQASTRRGSLAAYLDISHPDIVEFIGVRKPSGGDLNRKSHNIHNAVNITDDFFNAVKNDLPWNLVCPHTQEIKDTISARSLYLEILLTRWKTGEPYLHYIDESNRMLNPGYKDKNFVIKTTNLCLAGDNIVFLKSKCLGEDNCDGFLGVTIQYLYENKDEFKGMLIRSFDVDSNEFVWKEFEDIVSKGLSNVVRITTKGGHSIVLTSDHPLLSPIGFSTDFMISDEILIRDGITGKAVVDVIADVDVLSNPVKTYDIVGVQDTRTVVVNSFIAHNCTEIIIPVDENHTAVCCLMSVNLERYDEWKDTTLVADVTRFLDNVLQWFIDFSPDSIIKARRGAINGRDIGIGFLGWHYYLQRNNIPYESGGVGSAVQLASILTKDIKEKAVLESKKLGLERGFPECSPDKRNATLLAPMPTANASLICETSATVEPIKANIYTARTRVGLHIIKNRYLQELIVSKGLDENATWDKILENSGSIQGMDEFTEHEQMVYKTANEINQLWTIYQARVRQTYVDQAASTNLYFNEGVEAEHYLRVHWEAFSDDPSLPGSPLKTLYYLRASKASKIEFVSGKIKRVELKDYDSQPDNQQDTAGTNNEVTCVSCEG